MAKNVSHRNITTKNSNGDTVKIHEQNHYNEYAYTVTSVNGNSRNDGAYETLSSAVKASEK